MGGLCVMFGKWAGTETLSIDSIDFVFSFALTDPADNYGYWLEFLLAVMNSRYDKYRNCEQCDYRFDNSVFFFFTFSSQNSQPQQAFNHRRRSFGQPSQPERTVSFMKAFMSTSMKRLLNTFWLANLEFLCKYCRELSEHFRPLHFYSTSHEHLPAWCPGLSPI